MQTQRQKTSESEYGQQAKSILSLYGIFKGKYPHRTDEEFLKLRRQANEAFFKKMEKKFGLD